MKNIIVVENEDELKDAILNYDKKIKELQKNDGQHSNNKKFNMELEKIVKDMCKREG